MKRNRCRNSTSDSRTALESTGQTYEIIYINDGSTDHTQEMLEGFRANDPRVKVIEFNRNYGQHMALFAGFERAAGRVMVTIDADLQNPPEEIPRLIEKAAEGYDVVATYRRGRQDSVFRRWPSWIVNKITSRLVGAKLRDYGCMLRAYSRSVIDSINLCQESSSFIPALANTYARRIVEIEVGHEERKKGVSKYSLFRLLRLNFDLMTGFSLLPIQFIGILGVVIAIMGLAFAVFLLIRRLVVALSRKASSPSLPSSSSSWASRFSPSASSGNISGGFSRRCGEGPGSS